MDERTSVFSNEHPIERIMSTAMTKIKNLVKVDTIIGEPVETNGTTIIPISKVTIGLVAGGGEYGESKASKNTKFDDYPFAGGSGAGVSVQPIGFLIKDAKGLRMINMDNETAYDKLLDLVPDLVAALIKDKEGKKDKKKDGKKS